MKPSKSMEKLMNEIEGPKGAFEKMCAGERQPRHLAVDHAWYAVAQNGDCATDHDTCETLGALTGLGASLRLPISTVSFEYLVEG